MAILGRGITGLVLPPGCLLVGSEEGVVDELVIGSPGQVLTVLDNPDPLSPDLVQWADPTGTGSGGTITGGISLESGNDDDAEVYASVSGTLLSFRRLSAGNNITLTQSANAITISTPSAPVTSVNGETGDVVLDLGELGDVDVSAATSGQFLAFNGTDWVPATPPSGGSGESNNGTNLGTGAPVYAGMAGVSLQFRSFTAGTGIEVTQVGNEIVITNTAPDTGSTGGLTSVGLTSTNNTLSITNSPLIANGNINVGLPTITGVGGVHNLPNSITVDNFGRVTAVTSGTAINTNKWLTFVAKDTSSASATSDTSSFTFTGTDINTAITGTTMSFNLANVTGLVPGSYTRANLTVDAKGRVTAVSSGTSPNSIGSIQTGSGLATASTPSFTLTMNGVNGITTSVTSNQVNITLGNTGVTAGTYGGSTGTAAQFTVDAQGRITSAQSKTVLQAVVNDLNPSLGGNLNLGLYDIRNTTTNGSVVLRPNGTGSVNVSNFKITNLASPTVGTDAANKAYVDSIAGAGAANLDDLSDVLLTSPVSGQVLSFDGTQWVNGNVPSSLDDLSDVDFTSAPTTDQYLRFDGIKWVASDIILGGLSLDDLADVSLSTPSSGQILSFNGTQWINSPVTLINQIVTDSGTGAPASNEIQIVGGPGIATSAVGNEITITNTKVTLSTLNDIDFATAPTNGQFLIYNSGTAKWLPYTLPSYATNAFSTLISDSGSIAAANNSATASILGTNGIQTSVSGTNLNVNLVAGLDNLSDVIITAPAANNTIYYNGTNWVNGTVISNLGDLGDVVTTGAADNYILLYNGTSSTWEAQASSAIDQNLFQTVNSDAGSVTASAPNTTLTISGLDGIQTSVSGNTLTISQSINVSQLGDVSSTSPATGQLLVYDGTEWVPTALSFSETLDGLTDVAITSLVNNQILVYNGVSWINRTVGTINSIATNLGTLTIDTIEKNISLIGSGGVTTSVSGNVIEVALNGGIDSLSDVDTTTTPPSSGDTLMWDAGSNNWVPNPTGVFNLASDATPTLGGDLNVTGYDIISDSDEDVSINPGGNGKINLADMVFSKLENFTDPSTGDPAIVLTYDVSFEYTVVEYHYTSSTGKRIGSLLILTDGTDTSLVDTGTELGSPIVTFTAAVNVTDVEITIEPEIDSTLTYHVRQMNL